MLHDDEYTADRFCPVFQRIIGCNWCYECVLGFRKMIHFTAIPELDEIHDIEQAEIICRNCKYSDLE